MDIGDRFKRLRIARGYSTSKEFALDNNLGESDARAFENNQTDPSITRIEKFLRALNCSFAEFFEDQDKLPVNFKNRERQVIDLRPEEEYYVGVIIAVNRSDDLITKAALETNLRLFDESLKRLGSGQSSRNGPGDNLKKVAEKPGTYKRLKKGKKNSPKSGTLG